MSASKVQNSAIPINRVDHLIRSDPFDTCTSERQDSASSVQQWYALRTRSRHEKVASLYLARRGFEVFLPLVDRIRRWKDRRVHVQFPLFPGYSFIRCAVEQHRQVKMAVGVVEVVGVAGHPMPIPFEEVEAVRRLVTSILPVDPHPTLEPGMAVEVIRGPLAGLRGVLIRKGSRSRLLVGIGLLCQGASVSIDAADVVPV